MKKILFTLFALVLASGIAAQIPEPDFIGEVLAIHSDGTAEKLEKHNVKMRTGAGVYIAGLAVNKSKTKILVAGSQANVRFAADEPVNLIVRAVDNKTDPMSIVRVFAMKNNRKQRSAVISAVGSFNVTSNDMEYLPFTAEKYGENSYYLTFGDAPAGEYGIIVTNPNNVDEKMIIVSAFGIDADEVFTSWGVETAKKFSKADIERALTELDGGKYGMILRSKGIVDGGADGWLEFDYVPGEGEVRQRGADVGGKLVVIGSKLDEKAIAALFGC